MFNAFVQERHKGLQAVCGVEILLQDAALCGTMWRRSFRKRDSPLST